MEQPVKDQGHNWYSNVKVWSCSELDGGGGSVSYIKRQKCFGQEMFAIFWRKVMCLVWNHNLLCTVLMIYTKRMHQKMDVAPSKFLCLKKWPWTGHYAGLGHRQVEYGKAMITVSTPGKYEWNLSTDETVFQSRYWQGTVVLLMSRQDKNWKM